MKGMLNAWGEVLRLDLPDERLGGAEHEDQRLLVAQQRLDGLQMQLHLKGRKKGQNQKEEQDTGQKFTEEEMGMYLSGNLTSHTHKTLTKI